MDPEKYESFPGTITQEIVQFLFIRLISLEIN